MTVSPLTEMMLEELKSNSEAYATAAELANHYYENDPTCLDLEDCQQDADSAWTILFGEDMQVRISEQSLKEALVSAYKETEGFQWQDWVKTLCIEPNGAISLSGWHSNNILFQNVLFTYNVSAWHVTDIFEDDTEKEYIGEAIDCFIDKDFDEILSRANENPHIEIY